MKFAVISLSLILIIFFSGCTELDIFGMDVIQTKEPVTEEGFRDVLVISDISTLPSSPLLPDTVITLSFVLENKDTEKEAEGIVVELFDAPLFKGDDGKLCNSDKPCQPDFCKEDDKCDLLPGEQKMISFVLEAPNEDDIAMLETDVELNFRVNYEFDGSLLYITKVVDMEEVKTRQQAGEAVNLEIPKFLGSGPIQVDVELMGAPYILSGYSGTFLFTVKKVGDPKGLLKGSNIIAGDLKIIFPEGLGTVEANKFDCGSDNICTNSEDIGLYKGTSPTLYFKVSNVEIDVPYKSFDVRAEIDYTYELRDSIKVKIKPYV